MTEGVRRSRVGYTGGSTSNPTYRNMGDHTETVDLDFDPQQTSYEALLGKFWKWHSPTISHKPQYMSAIFYHDESQKQLAEQTRDEMQKDLACPIVTRIAPASTFYEAEDYHQKYNLRQHPGVLRKLNLADEDLIKSFVACRLNGYLGGYGSVEDFTAESPDFQLPDDTVKYILRQVARKQTG